MRITLFSWVVFGLLLCVGCTSPEDKRSTSMKAKPQPGISDSLARSSADPSYNLEVVGGVLDPFPKQPIRVRINGQLFLSGWAVDAAAKEISGGVEVVVDEVPYPAQSNLARGDVATFLKVPAYINAGFSFSAEAGAFGKGKHKVSIRVLTHDRKSYYQGAPLIIEIVS
jgi:hypothetical protein